MWVKRLMGVRPDPWVSVFTIVVWMRCIKIVAVTKPSLKSFPATDNGILRYMSRTTPEKSMPDIQTPVV